MFKELFKNINKEYVPGKNEPINLNNLKKDSTTGKVLEYHEPRESIKKESESTRLANSLFSYVNFSVEPHDQKELILLKKELLSNTTRTEQLLRAIELIPEPRTEKEYGIIGKSFFYLGAKYRLKSLEAFLVKQKKFGLTGMEILYFAQLLEREYFFEEAKKEYLEMIKGNPMFAGYYSFVATILRKQNKLDEALEFLNYAKETKYYKPYKSEYSLSRYNDDFKVVIDSIFEEITEKKKNGYVYKPRKSK